MYSLSVSIMAHPSRSAMVAELEAKLDYDPEVVWDEKSDRVDTGVRALRAFSTLATHHLVLQDDAVIPFDLVEGLAKIINNPVMRKDIPLCLYAGNVHQFAKFFRRKYEAGEFDWMQMKGLNWGVGVVVPVLDIEPLTNFMLTRKEPQYDLRISRYYESRRQPVWYPVPSLVDHREGHSLLGHGDGRHAWKFIGEDASALDFPTTARWVNLPLTRRFIG